MLDGVHFDGCLFDSVKFGGVIRDGRFDNREIPEQRPDPEPMRSVDFSPATLVEVDFWGCRFDNVTFPDEPGLIMIPNYPKVARRQFDLIQDDV